MTKPLMVTMYVCLALPLSALAQNKPGAPAETGTTASALETGTSPAPAETSPLRIRGGLGTGLGTFFPGPMISLGFSGRIGAQINDLAAVFLDVGNRPGFWLSIGLSGSNVSQSISGLGYWHLGVLGELTLGDSFFVAAGPMFVRGGWGSILQEVVDGNVRQVVVAAGGDFSPGVGTRLGFGFGGRRSGLRRGQFTIALDCQFVFAKVASVSQAAGSSGVSQSIRVGDTMTGITPLLMVGYDWK